MLQIAKVLKSNGTDGGILIGMCGISIEQIDTEEPVFVGFDGLPVPFFIEDITPKGKERAIVHITDTQTLEDAEELVGKAVYADYFDEEEDSDSDFIGWTVFNSGKVAGKVTGLENIPGNPCLCLGETLVPLHEDFILKIDADRQELHLTLPDGLI